jgi:hypothetical protein
MVISVWFLLNGTRLQLLMAMESTEEHGNINPLKKIISVVFVDSMAISRVCTKK